MDLKELKTKKDSELHSLLAKWREELRELRFKDSNRQLKNIREIRNIRKNVAQVLTLLNSDKNSTDIENNKNEENK
ncbi:MAG: 50S ribosomal protein L29 [Patescibacteria group bacterium]|nr:50S ribosomal protein L29 [Patescibacteria group bacterium]